MAAVYFMGARSGKKKSNGEWFGNATLLFKNSYGNWICGGKEATVWFDDEKQFKSAIEGIPVGASVKVLTTVGSREVTFALNEEFPDLLLE